MFEEYIGKYLGDSKVSEVKVVESVSGMTGDDIIVEVKLEDGNIDKYNLGVLKTCITENQSDLTSLREMKVVPLAEEILKLMLKNRFNLSYFDYLVMKVKASIDTSADKAQTKLWGKEVGDLNVADIDDILLNKK